MAKSKVGEAILVFIREFWKRTGLMPTLGEIADHFNADGAKHSRSWAWYWLKQLEEDGALKITNRHRGIILIGRDGKNIA